MTYDQALEYIHAARSIGWKLGLERIEALMQELGNPQRSLRYVHIAGTNGKGSTCAMTESILREAGYKTGMMISPYLEDFCERIQVMREPIPRSELARITKITADAVERLLASGGPQPSEFEIITAIGLYYFAEQKCDIVVLEVGMGGRLDSTNVIDSCEVAAITPISLDHTEYLGKTLELIAREKCGIFKKGCSVVCCPQQAREALEVITQTSQGMDLPLLVPDDNAIEFYYSRLEGSKIGYRGLTMTIPLPGVHQIQNALTAHGIIESLRSRNYTISDDAVNNGMAKTKWNGRFDVIRESPLCIIDGAHNSDAMAVLCGMIDTLLEDKKLITVMAMSSDKSYSHCVPMIARRSEYLIATQAEGIPKALSADRVAASAEGYCENIECFSRVEDAVARAMDLAEVDSVVLACGSLYMIGDAKREMLKHK